MFVLRLSAYTHLTIIVQCNTTETMAQMLSTCFKTKTFPVPLLFDTKLNRIVSTESDVILHFINQLGLSALGLSIVTCLAFATKHTHSLFSPSFLSLPYQ
jgi:hypothetical protein